MSLIARMISALKADPSIWQPLHRIAVDHNVGGWRRYTRHVRAHDAEGREVHPRHPSAQQFCLTGLACHLATDRAEMLEVWQLMSAAVRDKVVPDGRREIDTWESGRTLDEVIAMLESL